MKALHQYQSVNRQTSVIDADNHKLIQLLYDGALERILMAKAQMNAKNIEGKNKLIGKAVEILGGLREFLNKEKGGELALRLDALYEYMEMRLFYANLKNDVTVLDEVASLLKQVKGGWDGIRVQVLEKGLV
jgi:flagellar protein FliS